MALNSQASTKNEIKDLFPIVSVILPCYNAENVVSFAIESVANSSIAADCELIVVNDGSTDQTEAVINATCKHICNLKIKVIKTNNHGVSKARNTALDVAEGRYIAFLDADDCISPCMLENMVAFAEIRGADFSYCGMTTDLSQLCKSTTMPKSESKEKVFSTLLYRSRSLRFSSVLYLRKTIEKYHLRFDESLCYGEDLVFLWKYAIGCSVFISFNKPFYYYARDYNSSAMHQVRWEMTDVLKAVEQIREYIPQEESCLQESYDEYMIPRYILFLQKDFAAGNKRELFEKLKMMYPSVSYQAVIRKARLIIKVSAIIYSLSPSLYFHIFKMLRWGGKSLRHTALELSHQTRCETGDSFESISCNTSKSWVKRNS